MKEFNIQSLYPYYKEIYLDRLTMIIQDCIISNNETPQIVGQAMTSSLLSLEQDYHFSKKEALSLFVDLLSFLLESPPTFKSSYFKKALELIEEGGKAKDQLLRKGFLEETAKALFVKKFSTSSKNYLFWEQCRVRLLGLLTQLISVEIQPEGNAELIQELLDEITIRNKTIKTEENKNEMMNLLEKEEIETFNESGKLYDEIVLHLLERLTYGYIDNFKENEVSSQLEVGFNYFNEANFLYDPDRVQNEITRLKMIAEQAKKGVKKIVTPFSNQNNNTNNESKIDILEMGLVDLKIGDILLIDTDRFNEKFSKN